MFSFRDSMHFRFGFPLPHGAWLPRTVSRWLLLAMCVVCAGCNQEDPFDARAREMQYSIDSLVAELTPRLQTAKRTHSERRSGRADNLARQVADQEADRGGDGDRPDPHSLEAIVNDTATKLLKISDQENSSALVQELVDKLSQQAEVPQDLLETFQKDLQQAVSNR